MNTNNKFIKLNLISEPNNFAWVNPAFIGDMVPTFYLGYTSEDTDKEKIYYTLVTMSYGGEYLRSIKVTETPEEILELIY